MESFCVAVMVSAATSNGTLTEYSVVLALKAGESSASATLSALRVASEEPDFVVVELDELDDELLEELDELEDAALIVTDLLADAEVSPLDSVDTLIPEALIVAVPLFVVVKVKVRTPELPLT